jgi:hypothetical protein
MYVCKHGWHFDTRGEAYLDISPIHDNIRTKLAMDERVILVGGLISRGIYGELGDLVGRRTILHPILPDRSSLLLHPTTEAYTKGVGMEAGM